MTPELIDTKELAKRTGTGKSTWINRRVSGLGPPFIKLGRSVRYNWPEVLHWIENKKFSSTSEFSQA